MTTTTLPPSWLIEILRPCTPLEQQAIDTYRGALRQAFDDMRAEQISLNQLIRRWDRAIKRLATGATGTPEFDQYISQQRHRAATARTRREWRNA